ncbi:MAG: hypothetical protein IPJ65_25650 [Archangiaceae bacterium]|nr:hypothetical protein [Archangiaceae bacterium]
MKKFIVAVLALAFAACAHNSQITGKPEVVGHEDDLRKQAAFELGCNEQRLDVMNMAPDTAGVKGCEQNAVYKWNGASWALSSKESEKPAAAQ